jgi:hypothetical protein
MLEVVHRTHAFVHILRDVDTCCLFKCLRSSIHVRLYTCLGMCHTCCFVQVNEHYTCCFVQAVKVVHACALVHLLRDVSHLLFCSSG